MTEAEDAVQEAWLRLDRGDRDAIDDLRRWLTVVVARHMRDNGPRFAPFGVPVIVNGAAGVMLGPANQPHVVVAFTVAHGRITAIDMVGDPAKLGHVDLT